MSAGRGRFRMQGGGSDGGRYERNGNEGRIGVHVRITTNSERTGVKNPRHCRGMNKQEFDDLTAAFCARVAARIRERRLAKGISITRLAEDAHMAQAMIHYLENGARKPTIGTLFRVAHALGTTPDELLKEDRP